MPNLNPLKEFLIFTLVAGIEGRMDDTRLNRIENKLDRVSEHISSIDSTLAAQHVSLKEHMRRTALLESDMKPVKRHVIAVNGIFKLIGLLATLGAGYEGLLAVAKHIGG